MWYRPSPIDVKGLHRPDSPEIFKCLHGKGATQVGNLRHWVPTSLSHWYKFEEDFSFKIKYLKKMSISLANVTSCKCHPAHNSALIQTLSYLFESNDHYILMWKKIVQKKDILYWCSVLLLLFGTLTIRKIKTWHFVSKSLPTPCLENNILIVVLFLVLTRLHVVIVLFLIESLW